MATALSFGEGDVSAAPETFIVSVSTVSDILIAKSYWEVLANTENLKDKRTFVKASSGYVTGEERRLLKMAAERLGVYLFIHDVNRDRNS